LPDRPILVAGSFATAVLVAPLLPMLESAILLAASSAHRTVLLALVGIIATAADLAGTAVFGTVASSAGPRSALILALSLAAAGALALLALWFFGGAAKVSRKQDRRNQD
jgi:MFS family permease